MGDTFLCSGRKSQVRPVAHLSAEHYVLSSLVARLHAPPRRPCGIGRTHAGAADNHSGAHDPQSDRDMHRFLRIPCPCGHLRDYPVRRAMELQEETHRSLQHRLPQRPVAGRRYANAG